MSKTTYSIAVGRNWHPNDNTPAPDYTCGHQHYTVAAAEKCGMKLYASRYVMGSWQANATWHDWYVINNSTGHRVFSRI